MAFFEDLDVSLINGCFHFLCICLSISNTSYIYPGIQLKDKGAVIYLMMMTGVEAMFLEMMDKKILRYLQGLSGKRQATLNLYTSLIMTN